MKFFAFFLLLFFHCFSGQTIPEINKKFDQSVQNFAEVKLLESFKNAQDALLLSEKINYRKGIAIANIYMAKVLVEIEEYNKALEFLKKAESNSAIKDNIALLSEIHRIKGMLFS
jgi:hypothetical protein